MFASTPFSSRKGASRLLTRVDLLVLRRHPALAQVVRVVGDREVLVAARDGLERHLLDGVVPVRRPRRVRVEVPLQLLELDELGQRPLARRLQLAGVLAQLGRDELVAEELVQLLLVAVRDRLAGLGVEDAVLGDREPAPLRLLAHGDVVVLRAREVLEEVAVALGRNDAEVEAEAVSRDHGRLRAAARRHLHHPGQLGEVPR